MKVLQDINEKLREKVEKELKYVDDLLKGSKEAKVIHEIYQRMVIENRINNNENRILD